MGEVGEIGVHIDIAYIIGRIEPFVDARDRRDAPLGFKKGLLGGGVRDRRGLEPHEGCNQRQRVGDTVVDFGQCKLGAFLGVVDFLLGLLARLAQPRGFDRLFDGGMEQGREIFPHRFQHIVRRTRLERGHGNRGLGRGGDVNHRRRLGVLAQSLKDFEPGSVTELMIENHHVERAGQDALQFVVNAGDVLDIAPLSPQCFLHQASQRGIIVDIKNFGGTFWQFYAVSGTCMTEKNSLSCRCVGEPLIIGLGDRPGA